MNAEDRKILATMYGLLMRALFCIITPDEYLRETLQLDHSRFIVELREWTAPGEEQG